MIGGINTSHYQRQIDKEAIRARTDIVDCIQGSGVSLKRDGKYWAACCPFHDEKTPSFKVDPERQGFHCYGCGVGGDVFRWYMESEKIPFFDALKRVAEVVGIPLSLGDGKARGYLDRMRAVLDEANNFFTSRLPLAEEYVEKRGFSEETCRKWGLGFALNSGSSLLNHMVNRGFALDELLDQGLIARDSKAREDSTNQRDFFDFFRNRFMFPIRDHRSQLIGFAGRTLDPSNKVKYLNSRNNTLYRKGATLFGLHHFARTARKGEKWRVVEGYTDVISGEQAGIPNVVGLCGTALTTGQALLLKRHTDDVVLLLDGDDAGIRAGKKAAAVCFGEGLSPRLSLFPEKKDLDDMVRSAEHPGRALDNVEELDLIGFYVRARKATTPMEPDEKVAILREAVGCMRAEQDIARKIIWISHAAKQLDIPVHAVEEMYFQKLDAKRHGSPETRSMKDVGTSFVAGLLTVPPAYRPVYFDIPPESSFFSPNVRALYELIREDTNGDGAGQLALPLQHPEPQDSFLREEEVEAAFGYLRSLFETRHLGHFPNEVSDLFSRPMRRDLDTSARILRSRIPDDRRNNLMDEMFHALCQGDHEKIGTIEKELGELLDHGH